MLKTQHRFRSGKHNVFTEEVNKIAQIFNDDKRIQSIDCTYNRNISIWCKQRSSKWKRRD